MAPLVLPKLTNRLDVVSGVPQSRKRLVLTRKVMRTLRVEVSVKIRSQIFLGRQVSNLTKNFGFAMGIEFREGSLSIVPTCDVAASKGMVFNVNIGLTGIANKVRPVSDPVLKQLLNLKSVGTRIEVVLSRWLLKW